MMNQMKRFGVFLLRDNIEWSQTCTEFCRGEVALNGRVSKERGT